MPETAAGPTHPNLNLTSEEKRVFYQLFQAADTTNLGVVTGEVAVPFFEKTKLPPDTLGLIWQLADKENRGLLTPSGFSVVLRLIGHAQAGRVPTEELALQPGPLPKFEGLNVTVPPPRTADGAVSPPPSAGGPARVPPLNPDDVNKFYSLFEKSDVQGGILSGEAAKQIFERARLPNEVLGRIWNLADTRQRGALDATEFIVAMHLLTSYKTGAMRAIPPTLPPALFEAAARRGVRTSTGSRQGSDIPPVPAIPKQFTGPQRTQSPINRQLYASPLSAQSTGNDWLITPQEKAHYDNIFTTVDTAKAGAISGDQAVAFFTNAQLPEEVLAQIWDLADIDSDGQLTPDEFAVAMHLVRGQRARKEPLPQVLPPALIPPSMRRQFARPVPAAAPVPAPAPAPVPRSAADDLFGLDSIAAPPPPAAPSQIPQMTGGSNTAFQVPGSPARASSPLGASSTFRPFVPTSSFGQSLNPQLTGASPASPPRPIKSPPPPSDDLLGDNDPEESNKLTQETTELANLSNQIGSLSREMQNVQGKRAASEQELTQNSQQKRDFEARLAQARAMYEKEVKDFKALEERLNTSRAETKRLQQEYALIEGSRQDLQNQYNQVSAALAADQSENASLKEKIKAANAAVSQLKPALEKARSEARQQKGLVAINKKQLATVEGERDKIQAEIDAIGRDRQEPEDSAAIGAVTGTPRVASPAVSTTSQGTNPFFKRQMTGSSESTPPVATDRQTAFDNLFGPSFAAPTTSSPPPPTAFRAASPSAVQGARSLSKSPTTSGVPTPSVSPPPPGVAGEVPALSQSRQMTPSFLPLGRDDLQAQSVTSSTRVSPPASRFGAEASEASTVGSAAAPSEPQPEEKIESPFDEPQDKELKPSPFPEMPGNFPSSDAAKQEGEAKKDPSFDELFGSMARERSQSQKANDFDEAFASMKPQHTGQTNGGAAPPVVAESEFPPIKELDNDDDDDSTDSEAPMGFDDNFTPSSPPETKDGSKNERVDASQLHAFPAPGTSTASISPPPADSQKSPPDYNQTEQSQDDFPREFNGLLPKRGDPTQPPDAPHSVESSSGAPIVSGQAQKDTAGGTAAADQKPTGKPDFEAAFAGLDLAPAKETDDDDDDDEFETPNANKNPTDFDMSFDSPKAAFPAHTAGSSDFFSFDTAGPSADASKSPASGNGSATNHDWDALFAPLGAPKEGESNGNAQESTQSSNSKRQPGWALEADTGEDDLILQRLTGMGYPREESLAALEKFDYNIDKAADYLTSKS
ncbi:hypothetical protein DTO021D3_8942 [Paecilomyces variotii]|nr:hypothetical protein DTO032I3_7588 [Paecilomyces variotii]KAJ9274230.1 hypothetical protein DTO021D3_8942 [Paecilomyces variotii]KAJ9305975.1 hypothetical protein DTO217A2_4581 [Paecilomyces variotii]KAJ9367976.1 hypothetical protein DTO282E5_7389 [Paecilomyces variotii]KAJ9376697.1 hypothetical protein DTO032I4_8468 [Paecilomyces variotii]